mgnify:CR=1 FL=1
MNRNPHFLVTGMQKYDVCGSEMIYLKGSAYEKPFPIQYFPNPILTIFSMIGQIGRNRCSVCGGNT